MKIFPRNFKNKQIRNVSSDAEFLLLLMYGTVIFALKRYCVLTCCYGNKHTRKKESHLNHSKGVSVIGILSQLKEFFFKSNLNHAILIVFIFHAKNVCLYSCVSADGNSYYLSSDWISS